MAAIRGHFRRGTDPYFFLFCYQLAMYQVSCFYHKMHDSSQNCYISAPLLQMYCYCKCSVAFPNGAVGWSTVCDCGIS